MNTTGVFISTRDRDKQEECNVMTEAETEVMQIKAKECQVSLITTSS